MGFEGFVFAAHSRILLGLPPGCGECGVGVLWVLAGLNTSAVHRDSLCKTMPSVSARYKDEQMTPASHRSPKNVELTNTSAISRHCLLSEPRQLHCWSYIIPRDAMQGWSREGSAQMQKVRDKGPQENPVPRSLGDAETSRSPEKVGTPGQHCSPALFTCFPSFPKCPQREVK